MIEELKKYDADLRRNIIKSIVKDGYIAPSLDNLLDEVKSKIIEDCLKKKYPNKEILMADVLNFKKENKDILKKEWKLSKSSMSRDLGELKFFKINDTEYVKIHAPFKKFKLLLPYRKYILKVGKDNSCIKINVDNRYVETIKALLYDTYEEYIYGVVGGLGIVVIYPILNNIKFFYKDLINLINKGKSEKDNPENIDDEESETNNTD
ncbi:MAG: hypothetical protein KBA47_02360 [Caldisericia bacterium]|nr:hypothetical protein [Caldisericia bacterium]